jgi:glycosyltransferase involved in cell wall biosynthesis
VVVMSERLRILFAGLAPPIPTTNGHRVRCWSLLSALAAEGHEVTLVCFADPAELGLPVPELKHLCTDVRLVAAPVSNTVGEFWGRLRAAFSSMPYGACRLRSRLMSDAVKRTLDEQQFDLVICDDIYMLANLPAKPGIPILLNKHDITHEIIERFLAYEANPVKRLYGELEHRKVRHLEIDACTDSTAVLACSERDEELIRSLCPQAEIAVVPNVVDVGSYQPSYEDDGQTVLYVGAMDWFPNRDAVDYFISEIFPKLKRVAPAARFVVAGRNPSRNLRQRYSNLADVEFTGSVADMRPIIAKAAVCIVPLRIGSGTRLKILEAAAMGKATVSTRLGAEGLSFVPEHEFLLADKPDEFARAVASLLADESRRHEMGRAARRRVQNHYDVSTLRIAVREALEKLVPQPATIEGFGEAV